MSNRNVPVVLHFNNSAIGVKDDKQEAYILILMRRYSLLGIEHPTHKRVAGVTSRLLIANIKVDEIRKRRWSSVVVNNPSNCNAFVMPNGFIFVFSVLAAVANDDQLSIIVGHEMAHCILRHMDHRRSLTTRRSHETEADRVGLELAANACIDVTQGYQLWETLSKLRGPNTRIWWLKTHTTRKSRARYLYSLIPATMELQKQAGC
ncbi:hypothetical protein ACI65C_010016 [Semiaphis heraclei]